MKLTRALKERMWRRFEKQPNAGIDQLLEELPGLPREAVEKQKKLFDERRLRMARKVA
ncbi:MAG: hypothetical protein SFV32_12495 [Opitutaceae bacterium]|nr:hypothetical protein [Opitutaceae bacterium]